MNECPASPASSDKSGLLIGGLSLAPVPADSLTLLISALHEQTAAINRLASSNESLSQAVASLIDEMANVEEEVSGGEPSTYLDGSRVR
jgi:hypothetical protein